MKTRFHQFRLAVSTLLLAALCSVGCQNPHPTAQPMRPLIFTAADRSLEVTVLPSLSALRTSDNPAPSRRGGLKEFLIGPEESVSRMTLPRIPQGLAVRDDYLYVCDPGLPDIVAVNLTTGKMKRWTAATARPACPVDISMSDAGTAYVADTTLGALLVYDSSGSRFESFQPPRNANDPPFRPASVVVAGDVVYVSDSRHQCVERFQPVDGTWLPPLTASDRPFLAPVGLAVMPGGELLVADALAGVVHRLATDGSPLPALGSRGRGPGQFVRPLDVATLDGHIFVVDAARQSVQIFGGNGDYVLEIGNRDAWSGFMLPTAAVSCAKPADSHSPVAHWLIVSDSLGPAPLTLLQTSTAAVAQEGEIPGTQAATSGSLGP